MRRAWWKHPRSYLWISVGIVSLSSLLTLWQHAHQHLSTETLLAHVFTSGSSVFDFGKESKTSGGRFDAAASIAYSRIGEQANNKSSIHDQSQRTTFNLSTWDQKSGGGLTDEDRAMLGRVYHDARSVFEYGLGESTYIANHVGVPRYAGIDSDSQWVTKVRDQVNKEYRFYFADIGKTKLWGYPVDETLQKAVYDYQVAPLMSEPQAFDVYMVDGRFRVGCLLLSFLHASSRSDGTKPTNATTVLLHDCQREEYHVADDLLDLVGHSGKRLCAYKRKDNTTDEQLFALWNTTFQRRE